MSIPTEIKRTHILQAILDLKKQGKKAIPRRRTSTKYDVHFDREKYPPKYLISYAHRFVDGKEWPNIFSGGPEANNFLKSRGFKIVDKLTGKEVGFAALKENDESAFPEGRVFYNRHRARERDSKISGIAKNRRLRETGDLACDVCSFSFSKTYGEIGVHAKKAQPVPGELIFGRHSRTDANRTHVTAVFSALGSKAHACRNSGTRSKGQFDVRPHLSLATATMAHLLLWWR
jgi:hypothetical protein